MAVEFLRASNEGVRAGASTWGLDNSFSVSAWVKLTAILAEGYQAPILCKPGNTEMLFGVTGINPFIFVVNRCFLTIENDSGHTEANASTQAITSNFFQHLVATYDDTANEVKYYYNGALSVTRTRVTVMTETSSAMNIGRRSVTQEFDGQIADVAVWNRVLTANEVASMFQGCLYAGAFGNGLTGYWPLNVPGDGVFGDTVAAGDLGLDDHSGRVDPNDMDSTIDGTPTWIAEARGPGSLKLHWQYGPMVTPPGPVAAFVPYPRPRGLRAGMGELVGGMH